MRFIVLTGTSGSGKTTALHYFEDAGYYAVDNLPPSLLPALVESCAGAGRERGVVVVDSRAGSDLSALQEVLDNIVGGGPRVELIFLDASDEALVRRFKESRRPHPTYDTARGTILEAIRAEREMLAPLLERADKLIDTSNLSPTDLRAALAQVSGDSVDPGLIVTLLSFGFKHGLPIDADLVFDVRFLRNPHYLPEMEPFTGLSAQVASYVHSDPLTDPFLTKLLDFVAFCLPQYRREGKAYLTIAIGCTGGRHRSVTITEDLASHLRAEGYRVGVYHRDIHPPTGEAAAG